MTKPITHFEFQCSDAHTCEHFDYCPHKRKHPKQHDCDHSGCHRRNLRETRCKECKS